MRARASARTQASPGQNNTAVEALVGQTILQKQRIYPHPSPIPWSQNIFPLKNNEFQCGPTSRTEQIAKKTGVVSEKGLSWLNFVKVTRTIDT
eukprot:5853242-Amphidinium_carterae.1